MGKKFGWATMLLDGLKSFADHFAPPDLTHVEIYNQMQTKKFLTHFSIDDEEIPLERILEQCKENS